MTNEEQHHCRIAINLLTLTRDQALSKCVPAFAKEIIRLDKLIDTLKQKYVDSQIKDPNLKVKL